MHKNGRKYFYALIAIMLVALIVWGCAPAPTAPETPEQPEQTVPVIHSFSADKPEQTAPVIYSFSSDKMEVNQFQTITLTWNTAGADTVDLQPGIGPVGASGSLTLPPLETTEYLLTAKNEAGTIMRYMVVIVKPAVNAKPD